MTHLDKLPTWADKQHVYAVVETPRGSRAKLEFNPRLRAFTLAKPLLAGLTYPYDWGFIPSTVPEYLPSSDVIADSLRGATFRKNTAPLLCLLLRQSTRCCLFHSGNFGTLWAVHPNTPGEWAPTRFL